MGLNNNLGKLAEVLTVSGSGNVGLGKEIPNAKLDVVGNTIVTGSLNVTQGITGSLFGTATSASFATTASFTNVAGLGGFVQGGNSFGAQALIGTNDNQSLALETSGSIRMFVSSSGNVGIGTLTPTERLDVNGSIRLANGNNITWGGSYGSNIPTIYAATGLNSFIYFAQAGSTRGPGLSIINNGSVGIDNPSPYTQLDVNGSIGISNSTAPTDAASDIRRAGIGWKATNSSNVLATLINTNNDGPWGGHLSFYTRPAGSGAIPERMRITSDGNVGVGTQSPASMLHLYNTGIGTQLRIQSDLDQAGLRLIAGTGTTNRASRIDFLNGVSSTTVPRWSLISDYNQNGTNDFSLVTDNPSVRAVVVTQAGNVGIGTTNPGARLEINAASGFPIMRVAGGGDGTGGGKGNIRSSDQGGTNFWDFGRDNLTTGNFVVTSGGGSPLLAITTSGAATFSSSVTANSILSNTWVGAQGIRFSSSSPTQGVYLGNSGTTSADYATIEMVGGTAGGSEIDFTVPGVDRRGRIGYNNTSNYMWFETNNGTERMRIFSSGNVSIGSSSPTDTGDTLNVVGRLAAQNFKRISIALQPTPQSLGLPINAFQNGGAYLLLISTQWDAGNATSANLWMIRCGFNGNNFEAAAILNMNSSAGISFSQVNGILHIAGNTNWGANIQVISNNLLF
jgi:hypothetical protein